MRLVSILAILTLGLVGCQPIDPPPGPVSFRVEEVKSGLGGALWSINFAPDGRLLFTNRDLGQIRVSALNLSTGAVTHFNGTSEVRDEGEGGILGMELDPSFAGNNRVYVCYSVWLNGNRRNRLSRFEISGSSLTNELILLDNMLGASNHNGCRVVWGPDGKLYVSMGDAAVESTAQDLSALAGKIFRINPDGSIPTDNPFFNQTTGSARATWVLGLRNSQGLAFQPGTGLLWSTEHGPAVKDELNVIKRGRNYGWPTCMGTDPCPSVTNYQPAIKQYTASDTIAPSDMMFYTGNVFTGWRNNLFFVTLRTGRLYRLVLNGESVAQEEILIDNSSGPNPGFGRLRDIATGPDGLIYISTDSGRILRLVPQN
jgi:glucose/arabinose dehydrogenase